MVTNGPCSRHRPRLCSPSHRVRESFGGAPSRGREKAGVRVVVEELLRGPVQGQQPSKVSHSPLAPAGGRAAVRDGTACRIKIRGTGWRGKGGLRCRGNLIESSSRARPVQLADEPPPLSLPDDGCREK